MGMGWKTHHLFITCKLSPPPHTPFHMRHCCTACLQYDAFLGGHGAGRPHPSSRAEYERRGAQFRSHARMIEAHNAAAAAGVHTFTLAMNR